MAKAQKSSQTAEKPTPDVKAKDVEAVESPTPVVPNYTMKGTRTFYHHVFKLKVGKGAKNVSYKKGLPEIVHHDHSHIFHSVDRRGRDLNTSSPMIGHFHEVEWSLDESGQPVAKCGPAKKIVRKKLSTGRVEKKIVPVRWFSKDAGDYLVDTHKHEVQYMHTEQLSEEKIRAQQQATQEKVKSLMPNVSNEMKDALARMPQQELPNIEAPGEL